MKAIVVGESGLVLEFFHNELWFTKTSIGYILGEDIEMFDRTVKDGVDFISVIDFLDFAVSKPEYKEIIGILALGGLYAAVNVKTLDIPE